MDFVCLASVARLNFYILFFFFSFIFFFSSVLESAWRVPEWQSMKDALAQVRFWTDHLIQKWERKCGGGGRVVIGVVMPIRCGRLCRACWGL